MNYNLLLCCQSKCLPCWDSKALQISHHPQNVLKTCLLSANGWTSSLLGFGFPEEGSCSQESDQQMKQVSSVGRNINLRHADDTPPMIESKEELKSLLRRVKEESEKTGLKLSIQKTKIMSHHFMANRWRNSGNSDSLYFLVSKITADGDCSHKIKRPLLHGRKGITTQTAYIKKQRHYFADKGPSS